MRERAALIGGRVTSADRKTRPRLSDVALECRRARMTPLKSRILLADDHALVRRGLRHVLDAQPDLEVAAEAADGAEAVKAAWRSTST